MLPDDVPPPPAPLETPAAGLAPPLALVTAPPELAPEPEAPATALECKVASEPQPAHSTTSAQDLARGVSEFAIAVRYALNRASAIWIVKYRYS